jgi:hypothetical protein
MDTAYVVWHYLLAGFLGLGAFVGVLAKASRNRAFLRSGYWVWLTGALVWLAFVYLLQDAADFLWVKIAVAACVLSGVLAGGFVAVLRTGK